MNHPIEMGFALAVALVAASAVLSAEPWGADFTDSATLDGNAMLRHRVGQRHLVDNLEWREGSDGYQCSSHAHFSFVTDATKLVFEGIDFAHYGASVTPVVLNNSQVALVLPALPASKHSQLVPLSLPAGTKQLTVLNSGQTNAAWGGTHKSHTVRAIYADAPLFWLPPAPAQTKPRLVIYGDSIAMGGGATLPGVEGWGPLLRQDYDVAFEASGWERLLDDAKRLPEVADRIASYKPAVVWLAIGVNDYQGPTPMNAKTYTQTYGRFLDLLHERLPEAVVVVQSPIVKGGETNPNPVKLRLADYRAIIKEVAASRPWCRYADGAAILALSDLDDGVHPNTSGMAKYAGWAKTFLKGIVTK